MWCRNGRGERMSERTETEIKSMTKEQNYMCGYRDGKSDVLEKIRAEILEEKECAYADFERYKVEYLGQDPEDVLDSLPQDDFRYGMERAIEIIDKYKAESEDKDKE